MLLVIIGIRTPSRSWNIIFGMTHAHGNFGVRPPGLIQNLPTEILSSTGDAHCYTEDDESLGELDMGDMQMVTYIPLGSV